MSSNVLILPIKKYWMDKILSGEKQYEYREYKTYWISRIERKPGAKYVLFRVGYNTNSPKYLYRIESIKIGHGKEELGAIKNKVYFIIKLGERLR